MTKAAGWFLQRLVPRADAVEVRCQQCSRSMWLPPSKAGRYKRCSAECTKAWRAAERAKAERRCETCGAVFRARATQIKMGHGRFCSQKCNTSGRSALASPEIKIKSKEALKVVREMGGINYLKGADHPSWRGGPKAAIRRRIESGKARDHLRKYRSENPDKVKEFCQRRAGRRLGKLPYGTIPKIRQMQRSKCAICAASLAGGYHLDHILPLARGGLHAPRNLQLLCQPCNLRKSSRDPIQHMQSLGRLL